MLADQLARMTRDFYARGWTLATSGNFSAVLSRNPLRVAITPSGVHKGKVNGRQIVTIDGKGRKIGKGPEKPSEEGLLHLAVIHQTGAGAVFHTHSVWNVLMAEIFAREKAVRLSGFEMLKVLHGIRTHEHEERVPILENSQDMPVLARDVEKLLKEHPSAHAFLLRKHGLYTWGANLEEALRHVEALEYLLEVSCRLAAPGRGL